jgi:hypothetical protein
MEYNALVLLASLIYVFVLLWRLVSAQERVAVSLDLIARKLGDNGKP